MKNSSKYNNVLQIVDMIIERNVHRDSICVDGTLGNGKDALKIAKKLETGILYGFDIQKIAIENTKNLLSENNIDKNVNLIFDNHENADKYINENIDFAILNLGYLPGGDKSIFTKSDSTIKFMNFCLDRMNIGAVMTIALYRGFDAGNEEAIDILDFVSQIDQKLFNVLYSKFLNQKNFPPELLLIERI